MISRRTFLAALVGAPLLPQALAALPVPAPPPLHLLYTTSPCWWRDASRLGGASRPLTLKMMQEACDRIVLRESLGAGTYYLHYAPR